MVLLNLRFKQKLYKDILDKNQTDPKKKNFILIHKSISKSVSSQSKDSQRNLKNNPEQLLRDYQYKIKTNFFGRYKTNKF